ncbi:MAG: 26S protease regulatory subunit [Phycisphaerae bacterium]|nr:26S protease regulatory subunit [Phycisphaerae bacterium]
MGHAKRGRKAKKRAGWRPDEFGYDAIALHFDARPEGLSVASKAFEDFDLVNVDDAVRAALEEFSSVEVVGLAASDDYRSITPASIVRGSNRKNFLVGPYTIRDEELPNGTRRNVRTNVLYLCRERDDQTPVAVLLTRAERYEGGWSVGVIAVSPERAASLLTRLVSSASKRVAFRGTAFSVRVDCHGRASIVSRPIPPISGDHVIYPASVRDRIERTTIRFERHGSALRKAGVHMRRGLLLYGPPGNGKTLAAMYLVSSLPARTTIVVESGGLDALDLACELARSLAPATVVIEDVDLVGSRREMQMLGANATLSHLLDQMDGFRDDADVLFLLTTNRAEHLEPALAARPGRIDEMIEVPLPDADCRRRLFELYAGRMTHDIDDWSEAVAQSEGVSAALIKESLRRATLLALDRGAERPTRDDLRAAIAELLPMHQRHAACAAISPTSGDE